ncbi:3',5'-bisphosphate nucleotidase-like protein [Westerdykella ornata]|uniref:3',5'-bisphosphate nucleotidase-like protein n=1 Tax=Westerdykella ornata TaxID=318751 RepID=A0A6A6JZV4_WESOR|nr:3',5'-bisphosphate nucleotidase-like protein [Westerdykella ornata]KAF2280609.1 3',5'-bisphosphate nucleotidase-like protein [Westerdykella ornata]
MTRSPYAEDLALAISTVHAASLLTKRVLRTFSTSVSAETKADDSPVTIADFAAQAILIAALHAAFPSDAFVGEESAQALRRNAELADKVWELVRRAAAEHDEDGTSQLRRRLHFPATKAEMLDAIDLGAQSTQQTSQGRVWVLDPVDGTASFMENKQYAVCLCLLVDGVQEVAVTGCPNLKWDVISEGEWDAEANAKAPRRIHEDLVDAEGYGVLLHAVRGEGAFIRKIHETGLGEPQRIVINDDVATTTSKDLSTLNFIEATLGKSSLSQSDHEAVARLLSAPWPGTILWSQQLKYVALALGATDVMLRIPTDKGRYTHVWDHAGGHLLLTEAGGIVRDLEGGEIDFGRGRRILGTRNFGMVATRKWCFEGVMQAVSEVLRRRGG